MQAKMVLGRLGEAHMHGHSYAGLRIHTRAQNLTFGILMTCGTQHPALNNWHSLDAWHTQHLALYAWLTQQLALSN